MRKDSYLTRVFTPWEDAELNAVSAVYPMT